MVSVRSTDILAQQELKAVAPIALNMNANDYEASKLVDAYAAAETFSNPDFKLFISFDMSYSWSITDMVSIVAAHAKSPAQFKWDDKVLVSTYAGDTGVYANDGFWSEFKNDLANDGISISLAPAFTTYRDPGAAGKLLNTYPSIDGFMNWWCWYASSSILSMTHFKYHL